jgi:quercetin dioxygenase-like cupin family protein
MLDTWLQSGARATTHEGSESDMSKSRAVVLAAALVGVVVIGANVLPSAAHQGAQPITSEFLTPRSVFTDNVDLKFKIKLDGEATRVVNVKDPSRTVVAKFTVPPGAHFPWHSHAGPVVVNVTQGELIYVDAEDCVERPYRAGTAFVDAGHGHVHTAFNHTDQVTTFVATFYEAPAEGPLVVPAQAPEGCDK